MARLGPIRAAPPCCRLRLLRHVGLRAPAVHGQARAGVDALEILAHRALWAVPVAGLLVVLAGQGGQVRAVLRHAEDAGLAGPLDRC